jgi:CheY-like chemotaxis protein
MKSGGIITIDVRNKQIEAGNNNSLNPGFYVKVSIKDTGIGIPKKNLPKIFDLYFTTKNTGNGLGLSVSHSIINKHGGIITVDSRENEGTTFSFYVPASPQTEIHGIIKEDFQITSNKESIKGKVLILEDEQEICKVVHYMLKNLQYSAHFATDGSEILTLYGQALSVGKPFEIVILDLTIPGGMGGEETIVQLTKLDPNVKAIVSSGYSTGTIMSNYKQYGFKGVLVKPYTIADLGEVIEQVLK